MDAKRANPCAKSVRDYRPFFKQAIVFDTAHFGVNVFFVLPGFLITSLLIEEHRS